MSELRKRNKASLSTREPNLNGGSSPVSPTKSNLIVSTAPVTPAPTQTASFAKTASDILTPHMTDIEKLQKLKEWILADQHPYFTSAPKLAHLLSLRVSASASNANSNTSGSSGEQERPLSTIPLAERLSAPKMAHLAGASHQNAYKEEEPTGRQREDGREDVSMLDGDLKEKNEDMEMSESRLRETTGPLLTPTHTEPPHSLAYSRPEDAEHKLESYNQNGNHRQSPRNEARGHGGYADNRVGNGRYEPRGRYRGGGGYNNQGYRRFSADDREQTDQRFHENNRGRNYDRKPDFTAGHPDDRRNSGPSNQNRQSYDGRLGEPARARLPSDQFVKPLVIDSSVDATAGEDTKLAWVDASEDIGGPTELNKSPPSVDMKTEPPSASPTSAGGPPQSMTESITTVPTAESPLRSDMPLDALPSRLGQDERSNANHSPPPSAGPRDFKSGRDGSRDRNPRTNFNNRDADRYHHQDTRPRADSYNNNKFSAAPRPFERAAPPREDNRTFAAGREPYYRQTYAPAPPVDDRRFVPRDVGHPDEPGYPPRRGDYRPADWESKRRDIDRPLNRPYERERDRDLRGPLISPSDARGPRATAGTVPSRGYPTERDAPRGLNTRDPYTPPAAHESRAYDRDTYGPPLLPPAGSYIREGPRVRPRSLSPPPRRDYRPEPRPLAKRPRGPDDPYTMPPPVSASGHYPHANYGPPSGRAQEYVGDRRSIPSGPAQGAYYRPEDRGQGRY